MLDPALGETVPLANCERTCMLISSNGIKIGVIGLGEREWLDTINSLPPDIVYKSATETALELVPALREQGAEMIVAVTHMREPNDNKLAEKTPPGLIDIILGGHDHYYAHSVINGTHVLRSGTDFKQLSYIEAWRREGGGWDFNITRRDIVRSIPEDPASVALVAKLTSSLKAKLEKPVGYTASPLDGRFTTIRQRESNLGNFVCDLMRYYHGADCAMMAAGTMRGDQIYPPGMLRLRDVLSCFPFEDPVVVLRIKGQALLDALENGVSQIPALDGRFPQVSNITFGFKRSAPPGSRITWAKVGGEPLQLDRYYTLATRGYMARGKDGFSSLLVKSAGGEVEELVSEENGVLISTILRQYFLSLKVLGRWNRWSKSLNRHWTTVHKRMHSEGWLRHPSAAPSPTSPTATKPRGAHSRRRYHYGQRKYIDKKAVSALPDNHNLENNDDDDEYETMDSDSDSDPELLTSPHPSTAKNYVTLPATSPADEERRLRIARSVVRKWMRLAGLKRTAADTVDEAADEFTPPWTQGIAPRLEGRIVVEDDA